MGITMPCEEKLKAKYEILAVSMALKYMVAHIAATSFCSSVGRA